MLSSPPRSSLLLGALTARQSGAADLPTAAPASAIPPSVNAPRPYEASAPAAPPPPPADDSSDNLFPLMSELTEAELSSTPKYLIDQLALPLARINECVEALNDHVTDKRFMSSDEGDHITEKEIATRLRLGARSKTLILMLIHCGRLRGLDSKGAGGGTAGAARYRIVASP